MAGAENPAAARRAFGSRPESGFATEECCSDSRKKRRARKGVGGDAHQQTGWNDSALGRSAGLTAADSGPPAAPPRLRPSPFGAPARKEKPGGIQRPARCVAAPRGGPEEEAGQRRRFGVGAKRPFGFPEPVRPPTLRLPKETQGGGMQRPAHAAARRLRPRGGKGVCSASTRRRSGPVPRCGVGVGK